MLPSSVFVIGLLFTWVTPLWLISVGVALGVIVLVLGYGVLWTASRNVAHAALVNVREGILLPILYLAAGLTVFALVAVLLVPQIPARSLLGAVTRLSAVGTRSFDFEVPPSSRDFEIPLQLRMAEFTAFTANSDKPLVVGTNIPQGLGQFLAFRTTPGTGVPWNKPPMRDKDRDRMQIPDEFTRWTVTNVAAEPVTLHLETTSDIAFPEVRIVPLTALSLVALVLGYLLLQYLFPKVAAIALTTAKESMSQPLFYVVLALGIFALVSFIFIPYNTFGEDVKMLKDSGLTLILVLAIIVAVWSASVSVSEEVEGRTALTVLSKPVKRRQFILGKFLGVLGPVIVLFIVLGFLFLVTVSYKVVYDSREVAKTEPAWQACYLETIGILPGLVLAFLETVVLAAISVAISTRLPMLANLIVCASIYVLGHLVPMLVNSSVGKFEIVHFIGQFIATVLPVLDHFNIQAAVAAGAVVPPAYLGWALLYCVVYSAIALLLGLALFEDRDLA